MEETALAWRVAANEQSQIVTKGSTPAWDLGEALITR
jgi:hypothetical protein